MDKENTSSATLPKRSLPPEYPLQKQMRRVLKSQTRVPLKTINYEQPAPGTSKVNSQTQTDKLIQNDNQKNDRCISCGSLTWEVYKDKHDASDDETDDNEYSGNKKPKVENDGIKKIHNVTLIKSPDTEIQGSFPIVELDNKLEEMQRKRKLRADNCRKEDKVEYYELIAYYTTSLEQYYMDFFPYVLGEERTLRNCKHIPNLGRTCVFSWLLKVNGPRGNPAVVQTAFWYFDSFVVKCKTEIGKLQLVASACFWIAQKHLRQTYSARKLSLIANKNFSPTDLVKAEKTILLTLKFPKQPIVPDDFISFLSWCCDKKSDEINNGATLICLSGRLLNKGLCQEYPSVIAAASVYNAIVLLNKSYLLEVLETIPVYQCALRKTSDYLNVCHLLRISVEMLSSCYPNYCHFFEYFSVPPLNIAKRIIQAIRRTHIANNNYCLKHKTVQSNQDKM